LKIALGTPGNGSLVYRKRWNEGAATKRLKIAGDALRLQDWSVEASPFGSEKRSAKAQENESERKRAEEALPPE